ncbi:MAG: HAD hydrolase-like protein [Eubacteriales bacterium]|nr:HAD hydrolase-like protein [Eubacteriales bacterium]
MYQHILFDLDGTLIDSEAGITNAARYAFARHHIDIPADVSLRPLIGPPLTETLEHIYGLPPAQIPDIIATFREYYQSRGVMECEPFTGVADMLASLQSSGRFLYLATSKPEVFARRILERFDLSRYFTGIQGASLDSRLVEKADVIAALLENYGLTDPSAILMVGDHLADFKGAAVHRIQTLILNHGFGERSALEAAGATEFVDGAADILPYLERLYQ